MRALWVKAGIITNIVDYPDVVPEVDEGCDVALDPGGVGLGDAFDIATYKSVVARVPAVATVDLTTKEGKILRSLASTLVSELNILRAWLASFKIEVAASSSLADLRNRVATLPATPARTLAQAKTTVIGNIESGSVD
jgi:hypothetical protein